MAEVEFRQAIRDALDEERLASRVVRRDLGAQLCDPRGDLVGREIDLADAVVRRFTGSQRGTVRIGQEASLIPKR